MVAWSESDIGDLTGKIAVVTGANGGLGMQTTRMLTEHGAKVIMAVRDPAKAEAARGDLAADILRLDLADQSSVAKFAGETAARYDRLDLLINNAGVAMVNPTPTVDGFEPHLGVNHLGHMALAVRLLPMLVSTKDSRIVTITSVSHHLARLRLDDLNGVTNRYEAYFHSKLANMTFTVELARRLAAAGHSTRALASDPGIARTMLARTDTSRIMRTTAIVTPYLVPTQSAAHGALPTLRAAVDPDSRGGQLYSPRFLVVGPPVRTRPSRRALDPEAGRRLWELSLDLLRLNEPDVL
ncbi:SDR family NAD(P)-dependent oxidoreductase [Amycolatopsis sp. K13G38]|uniref:SDR family NAD(P)-dependent oxidoreductase n=1 Tax=Amycolatopsis acididurans TaxID=2724524 RepID=A0ABX1JI31_9PSEU|nr:oxidoreductase [Amycolatopsis acididurans]NKQ58075.1 SDR family NAD(P)-dependent oxidoreductase [Amycolatopsis acididurans]